MRGTNVSEFEVFLMAVGAFALVAGFVAFLAYLPTAWHNGDIQLVLSAVLVFGILFWVVGYPLAALSEFIEKRKERARLRRIEKEIAEEENPYAP